MLSKAAMFSGKRMPGQPCPPAEVPAYKTKSGGENTYELTDHPLHVTIGELFAVFAKSVLASTSV
jgi:hypothetical protein